ncbi:CUN001 putative bro protein, ATP_GTP_A motif, similar to AcMNPV ORF 2 [Culex nigripalpus nucleopolyhedrovirus]|uniref:CUN001 putative bro protein, ATP_GTP_A motif, similar to AcMNPV ORF 2 n=1 Tax=Culex nigripalpus nucleopolyhedrovirus (isolate Florida/1997) TaxID=645993 RepID=Q919R4_NPVCO|nr:CUN001 putative bro protein, ATP_GTP_A motif, similar to AcMNPV ORF 2 [Culex nigripalpus nucleopolyhedrovirus]AAK94079.1 CUN001 putative bro protein, ATP_GTP_A motif, similar to AcMNPV ORF 2 [Culex nigripalpus nucleopolyhedrovirus]
MSSSNFQRGEFASLDGKVVLPFYGYRDPETGAVWISGKSVATGLGYKDGTTSLNRRVSPTNRIKWRELCKDGAQVQLPDNWQPDTMMINQRGFRQLMGPKHPHLASMELLWCQHFGAEPLPQVVEDVEPEGSLLQLQRCEMDGMRLEFRTYTEPGTGEVWVVAKDVAKSLGYENPSQAHARVVDAFKKNLGDFDFNGVNRMMLRCSMYESAPPTPMQTDESELSDDGVGEEREAKLPGHLGRLVMLNEGGVQQLILESRLPNAKRYKQWVCGTVLPSIRRTGRYDVRDVKREDDLALAQLKADFAEQKLNNCELQRDLAITQRDLAVEKCEKLKSQYELMKFQLIVGAGRNGMLAEDVQRDLNKVLGEIQGRLIPELDQHKKSCITIYGRTTEDGTAMVRVCRHQNETADRIEVRSKRMKGESVRTRRQTRAEANAQRFDWLGKSEKLARLPCANGVSVWIECKKRNPYFFYGVKFLNTHQVELCALNREELLNRYRSDVENGRDTLDIGSELELMERCFTEQDRFHEAVVDVVKSTVEAINQIVVQPRSNGDYSPMQAINYFNVTLNECTLNNSPVGQIQDKQMQDKQMQDK